MDQPVQSAPDEYDSPWKEALAVYLKPAWVGTRSWESIGYWTG